MNKPQNKIVIVLAFFAIYVIWGSTYFLNKIAFKYWDNHKKDSAIFYFLEGIKYNQLVSNNIGVKSYFLIVL